MDWLRTGPMSFPVPILLIAFNRPAHTSRVLDSLRSIQPTQVFVAADGPRQGNENDVISCADVKRIIVEQIDWPCQVRTRFNSVNMGCRKGVEQAIDWFFDEVEEGIILEDDVVPTRDFFFIAKNCLSAIALIKESAPFREIVFYQKLCRLTRVTISRCILTAGVGRPGGVPGDVMTRTCCNGLTFATVAGLRCLLARRPLITGDV